MRTGAPGCRAPGRPPSPDPASDRDRRGRPPPRSYRRRTPAPPAPPPRTGPARRAGCARGSALQMPREEGLHALPRILGRLGPVGVALVAEEPVRRLRVHHHLDVLAEALGLVLQRLDVVERDE